MPIKSPQSLAESRRRRNAGEKRFQAQSVALMNDTKWREVWVRAARLELSFIAAFVGSKVPVLPAEFGWQDLRRPLPEIAFERHQIGDWGGMSGNYKDILWVVFPRRFFFIDYAGRKVWREQNIAGYLGELAQLGKLPLEVTGNFLRVDGYQPAAPHGKARQ